MDAELSADPLGDDFTPENREERLKRHCVKTTQALLYHAELLKDVSFKCSDQETTSAHKFLLGTQCQCVPAPPDLLRLTVLVLESISMYLWCILPALSRTPGTRPDSARSPGLPSSSGTNVDLTCRAGFDTSAIPMFDHHVSVAGEGVPSGAPTVFSQSAVKA